MSLPTIELKSILLAKRAVLLAEQHAGSLESKCNTLDAVDAATKLTEFNNQTALLNRQTQKLKILNSALGNLSRTDYLHCIECGEDITKRLEIIPETSRCCECQAKRESNAI